MKSTPRISALCDFARDSNSGQADYQRILENQQLEVGIYRLPANSSDPQDPHPDDEVYYVIAGKAEFHVEGHSHPIGPGSILFVPAQGDHHFHSIEEDLELLVFFART